MPYSPGILTRASPHLWLTLIVGGGMTGYGCPCSVGTVVVSLFLSEDKLKLSTKDISLLLLSLWSWLLSFRGDIPMVSSFLDLIYLQNCFVSLLCRLPCSMLLTKFHSAFRSDLCVAVAPFLIAIFNFTHHYLFQKSNFRKFLIYFESLSTVQPPQQCVCGVWIVSPLVMIVKLPFGPNFVWSKIQAVIASETTLKLNQRANWCNNNTAHVMCNHL